MAHNLGLDVSDASLVMLIELLWANTNMAGASANSPPVGCILLSQTPYTRYTDKDKNVMAPKVRLQATQPSSTQSRYVNYSPPNLHPQTQVYLYLVCGQRRHVPTTHVRHHLSAVYTWSFFFFSGYYYYYIM